MQMIDPAKTFRIDLVDVLRAGRPSGEKIQTVLTRAPHNDAPIGGVKVETASGWFAARPSGTEDIYKIYAESFRGTDHLQRIVAEAHAIVTDALDVIGPEPGPFRK